MCQALSEALQSRDKDGEQHRIAALPQPRMQATGDQIT